MVYFVTATFSWFFKVHFEMQELEYFSSFLSWFTLSQLHSLDFSKFILDFYILLIFQSLFWISFVKCKRWNISVVFCCGLPYHNYILLIFQTSFWISFVKYKSWNISIVFYRGLPCHSYILLIFQSSFWISFVKCKSWNISVVFSRG